MIDPKEAFEILLDTGVSKTVIKLPIEVCSGKTLAQNIICDHDLPPFDRVMMDGFALKFETTLLDSSIKIEGEQKAGIPPLSLKSDRGCIEVMTGCVLPIGCDTVVPIEYCERGDESICILQKNFLRGQNIHKKGQDHSAGEILVGKGTRIHSGIVGIAASCGIRELEVFGIESSVILSTGDELVDIESTPKAWQIRRSNAHVLSSLLHSVAIPHRIDHSTDEINQLTHKIMSYSDTKLLLITGAVSMGKYDLVPEALNSLGYHVLFHKVRQKPGKPLLAATRNGQLVIALPGNPISVMACACRYILPLVHQPTKDNWVMNDDIQFKPHPFTQFIPVVRINNGNENTKVQSISWSGSGDLASLANADGFVEIPPECESVPPLLPFYRIP